MKENQSELIKSVDVLREIMSQQGSVSGVQSWLKDMPSDFDPLEAIEEGDEEEEGEEGEEGEEVKPSTSKKKTRISICKQCSRNNKKI